MFIASIPLTNVPLPYSLTYLYPDAFNSRITGEIFGEKYGRDGIVNNGDEVKYDKAIDIIVVKADKSQKTYKVTPNDKGEFTLENIDLYKGDKVLSQFVFEDAQITSKMKEPELGLEIYLDIKKDEKNKSVSITGAIQNMYGSEPYLGNVVLVGAATPGGAVTKASTNTIPINDYEGFLLDFENPINTSIGSTSPRDIDIRKSSSPSSVFEFKDVEYLQFKGLYLVIEHNDVTITKEIVRRTDKPQPPTLEEAVVSPVDAYIDARINIAWNKDMRSTINKHIVTLQNEMKDKTSNVNVEKNNGVSYAMSMIPMPTSNEPQEYSFVEEDIKLVAKAGTGAITLTWNELNDKTNVKGYNIYRGTKPDAESLTPITSSLLTTTKYVDKKVKAGTKYYYLCSVVYNNGDEFIISNEVYATPRVTKR